jgi:hypothetical protein
MPRHAVILAAALAWLISIESAEARLDILVDKASQRMLVMQNGYMRYIWPVSTGRDETATPNGVYTPQRLERNWFSTAYYSSPMPYSIFFHNGYAIHGSYAIDRLGGPASHGCVRLHPHHAALLFDLVQQEGPDKTTIEITDEAGPGAPTLPPREIAAARDLEPPVPGIWRARPDGPPLMAREIPAERGLYPPPVPGIWRARPDEPPLPAREIPAERGLYPPVPGIVRARPDGLPLPSREISAERSLYPPVPGIVRYREIGDMPELPSAQRGNRPIAAKNPLPPLRPPPAPPPAGRRLLSEVRPLANVPRASSGPGEADTANGTPRQSGESSDGRPKPKLAEASSPEPAQQAPSNSAFKILPASCWSGGASRWRWWGSSQGAPCK